MTLTVKKTGGKLGPSINVRTESHGDETVGACDFKISGILLWEDDINELYDDKTYYKTLFKPNSKPLEPRTQRNEAISFIGKFENSTVTLWLDGNEDDDEDENRETTTLKLTEVKLRKITLDAQTGGAVELSLQVQCKPDAEQLGALYLHQNMDVSVSVRFGKEGAKKKAQPELPLEHGPEANGKGGEPAALPPAVN